MGVNGPGAYGNQREKGANPVPQCFGVVGSAGKRRCGRDLKFSDGRGVFQAQEPAAGTQINATK